MTDLDAIHARILAEPDEDTHRLVYADWLDEYAADIECAACMGFKANGLGPHRKPCAHCDATGLQSDGRRERAEFVRVQVRLALPFAGCTPVCSHECGHAPPCESDLRDELRRRERELMNDDNRTAWFAVPGLGVQLEGDGTKLFWWVQPYGPRIEATVSRGFVSHVTADYATLFGGPCEQCGGHGRFIDYPEDDQPPCTRCHGTGRTRGVAAALFARHPVTAVILVGREPMPSRGHPGDADEWYWWDIPVGNQDTHEPSNVGRELFSCLAGDKRDGDHFAYPTRDAALAALSAAAVALGRRRAEDAKNASAIPTDSAAG